MEKKIIFTESEIEKIIHMVLEQANLSDYTNEDFTEVFFKFFRPWIQKKHGDEVSEYPMSLLFKKYADEFINDMKIGSESPTHYYWGQGMSKISSIGREIVKKGLHKLPALTPKVGFLEKYKKPLEYMIHSLNLPSYAKIHLKEDSPFKVDGILNVNFPELIKSENKPQSGHFYINSLKKYLENYLGVTYGIPAHGHLSLNFNNVIFEGLEEWVKNVLNKQLKSEIRQIVGVKNNLHSIKFTPNEQGMNAEIKLTFKSHTSWNNQNLIQEKVKELLNSKGYNTNILNVVKS